MTSRDLSGNILLICSHFLVCLFVCVCVHYKESGLVHLKYIIFDSGKFCNNVAIFVYSPMGAGHRYEITYIAFTNQYALILLLCVSFAAFARKLHSDTKVNCTLRDRNECVCYRFRILVMLRKVRISRGLV